MMAMRKMMMAAAMAFSVAMSAHAASAPSTGKTFVPSKAAQAQYDACMKIDNFSEGNPFDCGNHLRPNVASDFVAKRAALKAVAVAKPVAVQAAPKKHVPSQKDKDAYAACMKMPNFSEGNPFDCGNHLRPNVADDFAAKSHGAPKLAKVSAPATKAAPAKFTPSKKDKAAYEACRKIEHHSEGSPFDCGNHLRPPTPAYSDPMPE